MKEKQLENLGFEYIKRYFHNEFETHRYQKGVLEVELTYKNNKLIESDVTIEEINCLKIKKKDIKKLDKILNQ